MPVALAAELVGVGDTNPMSRTSSHPTPQGCPPNGRDGGQDDGQGDEPFPFQWDALVPHLVHPMKVAIIEAMAYIREPLSAIDFRNLFDPDEDSYIALVSYHVNELAKVGAIVKVGEKPIRGALKKLYYFPEPE